MKLLKNRADAHEAGHRYYQGSPCPQNHDGKRRTANGNCAHCRGEAGTAPRKKGNYESATKLKSHPDAFHHAVMVFGNPERVAGCR